MARSLVTPQCARSIPAGPRDSELVEKGRLIVGLNGQIQFVHPLSPQYPAHAIWSADSANDGHVAWSPDGHRLAIAVTDCLAILAADGSAVASLTGCPGDPVAFAWTGTNLAAATSDGRLCAWLAPESRSAERALSTVRSMRRLTSPG